MRRNHWMAGVVVVLSFAVRAGAEPGGQQANATPAEAAQIAADALKRRVAASVLASTITTAAEEAARAAVAADKAAAAAETAQQDAASTLATLKDKGAAADKAAAAAKEKADAAAKAAAGAPANVGSDLAKLRAVRAAEAAQKAATEAATAAAAAAKAAAAVQAAAAVDAARKQIATVVEETRSAAAFAVTVSEQSRLAAEQLAEADQPVTSDADEDIFAALRVNLSGGAVFFNGDHEIIKTTADDGEVTGRIRSSQFSQATMYLAVESQPRLLAYSPARCPAPVREAAGKAAQVTKLPAAEQKRAIDLACATANRKIVDDRGYNRVYVEPFVNVRLTAIPVATGNGDLIQAPDGTFIRTEKAAQTQFGGLASMNFGSLKVRDSHFHWGIAPVFRLMFQNVTDSNRATRVWNIHDDLYHAITGGVRLSLYQKNRLVGDTVREGWSPVAYVDISVGKFQNFETAKAKDGKDDAKECLAAPAVCIAGTIPPEEDFEVVNKRRLAIEARLMLQFVYLGLDINNGDGGDDLRFIAGLTVKLDRFMRRQ